MVNVIFSISPQLSFLNLQNKEFKLLHVMAERQCLKDEGGRQKKVMDGSNKQEYIGEVGIYLLITIIIFFGRYLLSRNS